MLELLAGAALRSLLLATAVGTGLRLRRTYNPHVSLAAWTLVLVASLLMPVAMRLTYVALPHAMIPVTQLPFAPELLAQTEAPFVTSRAEPSPPALPPAAWPGWRELASFLYLAVFSALTLRLLAGLWLSWRIVRAATPIREDWVGGFDVRSSGRVNAPATFGSVILLPGDHAAWTPARRLAVLAHEGAHVTRRDFAIQLAAAVNRTVFWFNPLSWWLRRRLSDLAEAASDDAAIAGLNDRFGYAEILLEISGRVSRLPGAVSMARRADVASRIERILSEAPLPAGMSRRGRAMMAAGIVPLAVLLSSLVILPASPPRLSAEAPISAEILADESAAEDLKQVTPSRAPVIVASAVAPPPAAAMEATAAPTVPAVPRLAPAPRTEVASLPPAPSTSQPPRSPAAAWGAPRHAPLPMTRKALTAPPSRNVRQANRTAVNRWLPDPSPGPKAVDPVAAPSFSRDGPDPTAGAAGEDSQSPLFKRVVNETCQGTYSGVVGGDSPARPRNDEFVRTYAGGVLGGDSPARLRLYPVQAHFYRGPGDAPWIRFNFVAQEPANLPVTIKGSEIEFTSTNGAIYTLLPSRNMLLPARYHRLTGSTEHPHGGTIDFACGASSHPL